MDSISTRIVAFSRGQPDSLGLAPYEAYAKADEALERGKADDLEQGRAVRGGFPKLSPLAEGQPGFKAIYLGDVDDGGILPLVQSIYTKHIEEFGENPFGHIVTVVTTKLGDRIHACVTSIAGKLCPKPITQLFFCNFDLFLLFSCKFNHLLNTRLVSSSCPNMVFQLSSLHGSLLSLLLPVAELILYSETEQQLLFAA